MEERSPVERLAAGARPGPAARSFHDDDLQLDDVMAPLPGQVLQGDALHGAPPAEPEAPPLPPPADADDAGDGDGGEEEAEEGEAEAAEGGESPAAIADAQDGGDGADDVEEKTSWDLKVEQQQRAAARRLERIEMQLAQVSVEHSSGTKFFPRTMAEGAVGWTDRSYEYTNVPDELTDGVFFMGPHKKTPAGIFTLRTELEGTAFIWCEFPRNTGGFPELGWQECGEMTFAQSMLLKIYCQEVLPGASIEVPVHGSWIGGLGFKMVSDELPPDEEPEEEVVAPPMNCLFRCIVFLLYTSWGQKLDRLDRLAWDWNPLNPVERLATRLYDASLRRAVEVELLRQGAVAQGRQFERGLRWHWLLFFLPLPSGSGPGLDDLSLPEDSIRSVYRKFKPRRHSGAVHLALRGKLKPAVAAVSLCWRFLLLLFIVAAAMTGLAALVFMRPDLRVRGPAGVVSAPEAPGLPLAAGATVALRPLWAYPSLPLSELRAVEDVSFIYNQVLHVVRVAAAQRSAAGAVTVTGGDGSELRILPDGGTYWRRPGLPELRLRTVDAFRAAALSPEVRWLTSGLLQAEVVLGT